MVFYYLIIFTVLICCFFAETHFLIILKTFVFILCVYCYYLLIYINSSIYAYFFWDNECNFFGNMLSYNVKDSIQLKLLFILLSFPNKLLVYNKKPKLMAFTLLFIKWLFPFYITQNWFIFYSSFLSISLLFGLLVDKSKGFKLYFVNTFFKGAELEANNFIHNYHGNSWQAAWQVIKYGTLSWMTKECSESALRFKLKAESEGRSAYIYINQLIIHKGIFPRS